MHKRDYYQELSETDLLLINIPANEVNTDLLIHAIREYKCDFDEIPENLLDSEVYAVCLQEGLVDIREIPTDMMSSDIIETALQDNPENLRSLPLEIIDADTALLALDSLQHYSLPCGINRKEILNILEDAAIARHEADPEESYGMRP